MEIYKYLRESKNSREAVEFDITQKGQYITTCIVRIDLLLCGIKTFPCSNGNDVKLTPEQRLEILELVQAERKRITDNYPVKTYEGWQQSDLPSFDDYCFLGDKVDEEMIDVFVDMVPPANLRSSCTQVGEPFSHEMDERGKYRPTYITFHRIGKDCWQFDGYCFKGENVNRVTCKLKLQHLIDEARREVKHKNA